MAPSFLSKLVKVASPTTTSNRERRSAEASPRTSVAIPRSRSQSISQSSSSSPSPSPSHVISPTTPTQASTLNPQNTHIPNHNPTIDKAHSFASIKTSSTQPNVTIVPPSPLVQNSELSDDDDDVEEEQHITTPVSTSDPAPSTNDELPSSTPTAGPTSPNQNLSTVMSGVTHSAMASNASLAPGTYQVRKKKSNHSMKSVKKASSDLSLNTNHSKAATTPADVEYGSVTKTATVESPTDIKFPSQLPATSSSDKPINSGSTVNLTVQRQNTDTSSISGKSSRPWRRSTTRKPTGLASAIAASGLAMANPALSQAQQAQISPPPVPSLQSISGATSKKTIVSPGSPPYMSLSPSQSSVNQQHPRTRSGDLSPRSLKSKKSMNGTGSSKGSGARKSSVSVNSDNGSEYLGGDDIRPEYYSGLEDSSNEDDSGSDLDSDDLELGDDDIPVTGFAVASNKRNADFHELFPTVPEGDYLIEGEVGFLLHVGSPLS